MAGDSRSGAGGTQGALGIHLRKVIAGMLTGADRRRGDHRQHRRKVEEVMASAGRRNSIGYPCAAFQ
jgi:hypothetical protein